MQTKRYECPQHHDDEQEAHFCQENPGMLELQSDRAAMYVIKNQ